MGGMRAQGTTPAITRIDRLGRSSHTLRGKHFGPGPELDDHELSCLGGIAGNYGGDAENPVASELDLIGAHGALRGKVTEEAHDRAITPCTPVGHL